MSRSRAWLEDLFSNGVVASAHRLASEAGVEVLREGGNAIDALVTTSLTLSAVLPPFSGIGGGGFIMMYLASEGRTTFIDYREVAPFASKPSMYETDSAGRVIDDSNSKGCLAVAVPGTIRGLAYALSKYGTIDLDRALRRGAEYAEKGIVVTKTMRRATEMNLAKLRTFPYSAQTFLKKGFSLDVGDIINYGGLARSYRALGRRGEDEFYDGSIADAILGEIEKHGGILKSNDLSSYAPVEREPLRVEYDGYELMLAPPPSAGGIQIAQVLSMLSDWKKDGNQLRQNSFEYLFALSSFLRPTFDDRSKNVADPEFFPMNIPKLMSKEHIEGIKPKILSLTPSNNRSTTHLCAADKEGNVAALTESIECFYGSGVMVPETAILLNDTMHDFDPLPGRPNSIEGDKTPLSSMSPTIIFKDSKPFMTAGSAGGPRIVSATLQTILNVIEFGLRIQEAINSPRCHYQGGKFTAESRIGQQVLRKLEEAGHVLDLSPEYDLTLGGVQGIKFDADGLMEGGADPRREAVVVGF